MQFNIPNPLRWLRHKSPAFTASAASADSLQTHAAPIIPRPGPASPSGFMASSMSQPSDVAAKVVGSYRYRTATPTARAEMLRHAASQMTSAPASSVAPLRSGPAKVTPVKAAPCKADWDKLTREMASLAALADRAVARVRAEKARAEIASLTGLDKTRAAIRAQFSGDDVSAADVVDEKKNVTKICQRSKPSQNPAFVPEPSVDVRLRECRAYYEQLIAENEVEYQAALKAGRIPQELLSRRSRTQREFTLALDKIRGVDVRSK